MVSQVPAEGEAAPQPAALGRARDRLLTERGALRRRRLQRQRDHLAPAAVRELAEDAPEVEHQGCAGGPLGLGEM